MKLLVIGAGGHAKVVVDAALASGLEVAAVLGQPGDAAHVLGVPVVHDATSVTAEAFIVAVGDNATRAAMFAEHSARGLLPATVVHPAAVVAPSASVGAGTFLAAGVVVNAEARVGVDVICNTGCTIDHDCVIGDHAHIGPGANLCGAVTIGDGTLVGVGACAMPGVTIGAWGTVGAGATVIGDLPDGSVSAGVPARPLHPGADES